MANSMVLIVHGNASVLTTFFRMSKAMASELDIKLEQFAKFESAKSVLSIDKALPTFHEYYDDDNDQYHPGFEFLEEASDDESTNGDSFIFNVSKESLDQELDEICKLREEFMKAQAKK